MRDLMTGTGGCLVGGVPLPNSFFYFESISKIHCAGGRLCHPPALWFRGGEAGTRQQRQSFVLAQDCWRVLRPPTQMPLAVRTNRLWPSEFYTRLVCSKLVTQGLFVPNRFKQGLFVPNWYQLFPLI
jgi:hypothetical protein